MDNDDDCVCITAEEFSCKDKKSDVNNAKRRRFTAPESSALEGECEILTEAPADPVRKASVPQDIDDGDDIKVTAVRGQNALVDWPHSRPDCARKPFSKSAHEDYCDFCYCYVCDVKCSECPYWRGASDAKQGHCHAESSSAQWVHLRAQRRIALKRSAAAPSSAAPLTHGVTGAALPHGMPRSFQNLLQRSSSSSAERARTEVPRFRVGVARPAGPSPHPLQPAVLHPSPSSGAAAREHARGIAGVGVGAGLGAGAGVGVGEGAGGAAGVAAGRVCKEDRADDPPAPLTVLPAVVRPPAPTAPLHTGYPRPAPIPRMAPSASGGLATVPRPSMPPTPAVTPRPHVAPPSTSHSAAPTTAHRHMPSPSATPTPAATDIHVNRKSPEWWMRQLEEAPRPDEHATPAGMPVPLKKTQRQSLGFMVGVETRGWKESLCCPWHSIGGVLADEVGMGKTAVCIALILAHPFRPSAHADVESPILDAAVKRCIGDYKPPKDEGMRLPKAAGLLPNVKGTLVIAPSSVLGQWKVELARFAPSLKVLWNYGQGAKWQLRPLNEYDIVLTTPGTAQNDIRHFREKPGRHCIGDVRWHRLILDEVHTIGTTNISLNEINARFRWGVTATPMTKSIDELHNCLQLVRAGQPALLSYHESGLNMLTCSSWPAIRELLSQLRRRSFTNAADEDIVAQQLCQVVVRHTKRMLAQEPQDALPARSHRTAVVTLSPDERLVYEYVCRAHRLSYITASRCSCQAFRFDSLIGPPLQACNNPGAVTFMTASEASKSPAYVTAEDRAAFEAHKRCAQTLPSKFLALQGELRGILSRNPTGSVIILSRSLMLQERLREAVAAVGYGVIFFDGSHNATKRGQIIQMFQEMGRRQPTALCLTLRTAAVGITLTAGSTVILVHRMGQTEDVQLVRLVTKDTLEEKIVELCESRREGRSGADHNDFSAREVEMVLAPMLRQNP
eukprot:jgi/Mesvir1/11261/Mv01064-RA.2